MNAPLNTPSPQFGTAEYVGTPGGDHCHFCHQSIGSSYYRINDSMACAACAEKLKTELTRDSSSAFAQSILFGIGAAILGMIAFAVFAIATGIMIGYVSLAVGWMVGKAMLKGSGGITGRRYQAVAVLLTYLSVTLARIPIWIHYRPDLMSAIPRLIPHALIFPFVRFADDPFGGAMGAIILFVGLSIAFRLTAGRKVQVNGPFENKAPALP